MKGKPIPKGRPRFGKGHVYTPKRTKDYEELVYWEAKAAGVKKLKGLVKMTVKIFVKSILTCGDLTNIVKSIEDGLNGVAYADDKQIVSLIAQKLPAKHESVEITVEDYDG